MPDNLFGNLSDPTKTTAEQNDIQKALEKAEASQATEASKTPEKLPMSDSEAKNLENDEEAPMMDELTMLKQRAQLMGISHSNNIGIEALKNKINSKLEGEKDNTDIDGNVIPEKTPAVVNTLNDGTNIKSETQNFIESNSEPEKPISLRQYMHDTQMKLVRVRITNLDPKKKDLPGEIITVANEYLGTVKKYIPFGEVTDNGYHIPQCLYDVLKERTFVSIKIRKGTRGQEIIEHQNAKEFALDVLPPLTSTELAQLATSQQAKGGLDSN